MSLLEIRAFMQMHKIVSLKTLIDHFQCDEGLLKQMMHHWVRKGCVRCFTKTPACGTRCAQCPAIDIQLYEWQTAETLSG